MSENRDLVRSIHARWERGDFSSASWDDPEIDYEWADGPARGRCKGFFAMNAVWREFASACEDFSAEAVEFRALDGERGLSLSDSSARRMTSGLDLGAMRARGAGLWHVGDGMVTKLVIYLDRDHALAELGVED
jgi:ketosteroid isomerase-like protein